MSHKREEFYLIRVLKSEQGQLEHWDCLNRQSRIFSGQSTGKMVSHSRKQFIKMRIPYMAFIIKDKNMKDKHFSV